jgi:hypothetical protein
LDESEVANLLALLLAAKMPPGSAFQLRGVSSGLNSTRQVAFDILSKSALFLSRTFVVATSSRSLIN